MKEKKKTGYIGKKEELNENGICRNVWVDGRYIEKKKKKGKGKQDIYECFSRRNEAVGKGKQVRMFGKTNRREERAERREKNTSFAYGHS